MGCELLSREWLFRAVYKKDRQGDLLDEKNNIVPFDDPEESSGKPCIWRDIHLGKGMRCVDCHFAQDARSKWKSCMARRAIRLKLIALVIMGR